MDAVQCLMEGVYGETGASRGASNTDNNNRKGWAINLLIRIGVF